MPSFSGHKVACVCRCPHSQGIRYKVACVYRCPHSQGIGWPVYIDALALGGIGNLHLYRLETGK